MFDAKQDLNVFFRKISQYIYVSWIFSIFLHDLMSRVQYNSSLRPIIFSFPVY